MKPTLELLPLACYLLHASIAVAQGLTAEGLTTYVDALTLPSAFDPVKASYWTNYPHHRRTPFAVSASGKAAYLAYLDISGTKVHVQAVDPSTFAATGSPVTVAGAKEAGGLVAHDDGFALLTNEALPAGTGGGPPDSTPVAVLYRYDASGAQRWKTFLGGPSSPGELGDLATPDLNGDLVHSPAAGLYAAYFVVTAYTGYAKGHFGDAVRYVDASSGSIKKIEGATSDWGCSHNTGIAFEAAEQPPFASVCAEDQGALWLNTRGQGMMADGAKVSNENTTNGGGGESLGGMSGSYSSLARLGADGDGYILAWVSRGARLLKRNDWMGDGFTNAENRTNGRNVALAVTKDKYTLAGEQASSRVGATDGDAQVNWLTQGTADCSNAHVAAFDKTRALVTWEQIDDPFCDYVAMGCRGKFSGTYLQLVDATGTGSKVGAPLVKDDVYVAGDMVTMTDGRICWPYVSMAWELDAEVGGWGQEGSGKSATKVSFACVSNGGSGTAKANEPATPVSSGPAGGEAQPSPTGLSGGNGGAVEPEPKPMPEPEPEPTKPATPATGGPCQKKRRRALRT